MRRRQVIYKTLMEATQAARILGAPTARDYIKLYRLDEKLPSNPSTYYENWVDWPTYLGVPSRDQKFYKSVAKASAAAQRLNIKTARDYIKRYKEDSKLHSNPSQYYANWPGWNRFLKKKRNLKEVRPVKALNLATSSVTR